MLYHFKSFLILFLFSVSLLTQISAQTQPQTAKDFFEQGMRFVREQKFNEALEAFRQSARLEPNNPSANANMGMALVVLNRPAEAVAPYREAVRLMPSEARFHLGLCQALSKSKNDAEAITQCEEAVRLDNNMVEARLALITALRAAKRYNEALRAAGEALQKFREHELLLLTSAELNFESGNFTQALSLFETLAQMKPQAVYYQVKLAENYLRLERDSEAIAAAHKALEIEKHPLAYFFLGRVYFELGQHEEAADAFRQAVALDAKLSDAFYFLGVSEERRGKPDKAIAALRQAVALDPQNYEYNEQLGSILNSNAQYEEAIAPMKKAVALQPSSVQAKVGLGLALFESANYEEALAVLAEADRMQPGNRVINMFQSVTRARQQGLARIAEMKQEAKENPKDVDIRLDLVKLLGFARRLPEAEVYVEEIRRLNPKEVIVYLWIATVYSTAGKLDKALEIYQKALEMEQHHGTYMGLASLYEKRGQIEEALKAYAKVIEIKPDASDIMILYANLLSYNGKRREALEMYKRSLEINPANPPAVFNAGVLSAKLGDLNAARQYLEMLRAMDPESARKLSRFLKIQR